ncbi:MAG TPA: hypothetical protein VIX84_02515, partial [Acidimicrobiales bacterium]
LTFWSVFTSLVVPRTASSRLQKGVGRFIGAAARRLVPKLPGYETRDRLLSVVGPGTMVALFGLWLGLLVLGFALIEWWNSGVDFGRAVGISGSSVFTLGIATANDAGARTIEILAAALGLLFIALEIAYLPALYNAFAVRETDVTLLAPRSGTPAWGPEILARAHWLDTMNELAPLYAQWERWAAAVSESHANYPALMWFRSPAPLRSWLLGLVAMMDSAALFHAASPNMMPREGRTCLQMGINCLRSMAGALKIPFDPDPLPSAYVRLTREDFDKGIKRLQDVGFPMERDVDETWRQFRGWRVNYEGIVDALAALILPPPAPWFVPRPELGPTQFPVIYNRTPDEPQGAQVYGVNKTFKTPSDRESNNS